MLEQDREDASKLNEGRGQNANDAKADYVQVTTATTTETVATVPVAPSSLEETASSPDCEGGGVMPLQDVDSTSHTPGVGRVSIAATVAVEGGGGGFAPLSTLPLSTLHASRLPADPRDSFEVSELQAQLSASQLGGRVVNHVWKNCTNTWLKSTGDIPSEIKGIAATVLSIVDQENDQTTLLRRAHYGLETKNGLVDRLKEEVDLFMMTPECTPALCHLDALKEQLAFHFHRISQHVTSFADVRLRALPVGGDMLQALCIGTWAQCVGYELLCELLDSLIKEIEQLRTDCIQEAAQERTREGRTARSQQSPAEAAVMESPRRARSWSHDAMQVPRQGGPFMQHESPVQRSRSFDEAEDGHGPRQQRPKRAASISARLHSTSSAEQTDSDYDDDGSGRKRSKFRSSLPVGARNQLDAWLSSHWHDPYPTPDEKAELASICDITVDQVNHWFINARVRRWRPTMEKAAQNSKTTGSTNAFAALVKDCGETNPFAKFLGPLGVDGMRLPQGPPPPPAPPPSPPPSSPRRSSSRIERV